MWWQPGFEVIQSVPSIATDTLFGPLQLVPQSGGCNLVTMWVSWGVWHLMILGPIIALTGVAMGRFVPLAVKRAKYRLLLARLRNGALQAGILGGFLGGIFFIVIYLSVESACLYLPI